MHHSDTVHEKKKKLQNTFRIMTNNQNMNKTSMKDVQQ